MCVQSLIFLINIYIDLLEHRKSPTTIFPSGNKSPTGHRSPLNLGIDFDRRSPTSTVHVQDQKSPTAVLLGFDDVRRSPTSRRSPVSFSQGMNGKICAHLPKLPIQTIYLLPKMKTVSFYRIKYIACTTDYCVQSIRKFGNY